MSDNPLTTFEALTYLCQLGDVLLELSETRPEEPELWLAEKLLEILPGVEALRPFLQPPNANMPGQRELAFAANHMAKVLESSLPTATDERPGPRSSGIIVSTSAPLVRVVVTRPASRVAASAMHPSVLTALQGFAVAIAARHSPTFNHHLRVLVAQLSQQVGAHQAAMGATVH